MSIQSEITRLSGNVSDALTAIANKGVTIPTGSNSDDLATLIGQIQQGGQVPSGIKYSWEAWDDGAIDVSGYEYCVMNGMPVNDGHYRAWIDCSDLTSEITGRVTIRFNRTSGTVKIDWGDGSAVETLSSSAFTGYKEHSYSTAGKYVIDVEFVSGNVGIYSLGSTIKSRVVHVEDAALNDTSASANVYDETKLKSIFQNASARYIARVTGCTNLELFVLSPNLTSIPTSFIKNCTSMKNIKIPSNVNKINGNAFEGCSSLLEIHFLPSTPPTLTGSDWFTGISSSCVFYVPTSALSDYQSATNWSAYASRMVGE